MTMSSTSDQTQQLLEEAGALKRGHFVLSSGLHSDRYCQCAALFERPEIAHRVARLMAEQIPGSTEIDTVLAPALGGVLWGYELARALAGARGGSVRTLFAERGSDGAFALRRGFALDEGERVLLAEDVVTTGGSVMELTPLVERAGAKIVGFAAIADRSRGAFRPPAPFFALTQLNFETWAPNALPAHLKGVPIDKPGSRPLTGATRRGGA